MPHKPWRNRQRSIPAGVRPAEGAPPFQPTGALYLECVGYQRWGTWLGAWLNVALVSTCGWWLIAHRSVATDGPWYLLSVILGMFLGDVASGAIHWATDVWFDEVSLRRLSAIGREHHIYPQHILDYPFRDYVGYTSWPSVLFFAPMLLFLMFVQSPTPTSHVTIACLAQVTGMMFFGTHFHRFGHAAARNPIARVLQKAHLLITPAQHAMHHYGTRRTHYCVVNGWANPIFDGLKIWRFLEWVTHSLTGAVPHRNETEWYQRFVQDPTFMVDPVPSLIELRAEAARVSD